MLIHSYMTDGFFDFGKILLQSFKKHHGEDMPFLFTTRNLKDSQIDQLYSLYKNLIVSNEQIDMKALSEKAGRSVAKLRKAKWQVENIYVKRESVIWKQYISVEDRYRNSLQDALAICGDAFIHLDADSFINRPLDPLFKIVESNDVSLIFRGGPEKYKIFGCLMGFRFCPEADKFLETWRKHIDAIPLQKKPRAYGQTSCWRAYLELKNSGIRWGKIPRGFVSPTHKTGTLIVQGNTGRKKATMVRVFMGKLR